MPRRDLRALQVVQSVEMALDAAVATNGHATARKLLKAVEEFHTYIENITVLSRKLAGLIANSAVGLATWQRHLLFDTNA